MFKTDDLSNLTLSHIVGPATCADTLKRLLNDLTFGLPCESYLNIYTTGGKHFSSFVSFRINNVTSSESGRTKTTCGVLNIAAANAVGNVKFLSVGAL
jgi:hypothetical protein